MSVEQMRMEIAKVYDTQTWQKRVRQMADNQVIAVYRNFQRTGRFDKKPATTLRKGRNHNYHQMTIFDYV